jgi:hypothetical protein
MWPQNFLTCFEESTLGHPRLEEALRIKEQHLPNRIYKYRRDSKESRLNLDNDTVWISSPDSYNDPYDCSFTVSEGRLVTAFNRAAVDSFVKTYKLQEVIPSGQLEKAKSSEDPLRAVASLIPISVADTEGNGPRRMAEFSAVSVRKFIGDQILFLRQMRRATKVCSFSEVHDSILLWSHYAQNHSGFFVEYDLESLTRDHPFRRNLYPIIYSPNLYDLTGWSETLVGTDRRQFNPIRPLLAALHKFEGWQYEREWRVVMIEPKLTEDRCWEVPTAARLFLGSQMQAESKRELRAICAKRKIEVWQMGLASSKFQLLAERLD